MSELPIGTKVMFVEPHFISLSYNSGMSFEYGVRATFMGYMFADTGFAGTHGILMLEDGKQVVVPMFKICPLVENFNFEVKVVEPSSYSVGITGKQAEKIFVDEYAHLPIYKVGNGFVDKEEIWAAVKAFGDGMF